MSETEERFDQRVIAEIKKTCESLVSNPEVRSVAVVIDWDLPETSAGGLPSGLWRSKAGQTNPMSAIRMQQQLAVMISSLCDSLCRAARQGNNAGKQEEDPCPKQP